MNEQVTCKAVREVLSTNDGRMAMVKEDLYDIL